MNNSTDNSNPSSGGFSYGLGVFIGVLTILILLTLVSYLCTRIHLQQVSANNRFDIPNLSFRWAGNSLTEISIEAGLDEATLQSYPKFLYSQAKACNKGGDDQDSSIASSASCSICLGDYKDSDMLRLLPDCCHSFHLHCVDAWLRVNPSCPICRHSPLPTPLPTPLAEVAPLTMQQR